MICIENLGNTDLTIDTNSSPSDCTSNLNKSQNNCIQALFVAMEWVVVVVAGWVDIVILLDWGCL
ncbi:hypothetical protein L484_016121 [Morus notabilis]|uniref:Transmembrane protein n=1 Tax=Morus notabilis TaxID=981085 RepID=W9QKX6_9ROSA|nr:hypothetical protein L484_016121 [Morus notabilis]